jgi:Secretion system C-terminal sorting domain
MKKYLYLIFIYCLCHNISFAQKWLANTSSLSLISAGYQISHIIPVDDSLVWVLLSDQSYTKPAKLLRTRDSGNSWQASSIPNTINNDAFKIVSFDSLSVIVHIYTITDTSVLYKTTDGGKSWTKKLQVPNIGNLGFFDKKNGILVGAEENLVALTSDGGETWKVDSTTAKSFAKPKVGWFAVNSSTDSTILYQWDGSSVLLSSSALVQKIDFSVYPNPSMGSINIEWRNLQTPPQYLRVLDLMGKIVYEKKQLNLGDVNQNLDLQNLVNGLYFIEISTTNGIGLKKIMIQH